MDILNRMLSKWFVPKSQYENTKTLAQTYLEQLEDYERTVETKKLFARKIEYLGRLLLDESFFPSDVETDEFYSRLESQINHIRRAKSEIGYRLARVGTTFLGVEIASPPLVSDTEYTQIEKSLYDLKQREEQQYLDLRKLGTIALCEGDFEFSSDPITREDIDRILLAIAQLRGEAVYFKMENKRVLTDLLAITTKMLEN